MIDEDLRDTGSGSGAMDGATPEQDETRGPAAGLRPEGVLFDMDGVVTDTATAHAAAWKRLFDGFFEKRSSRDHTPFHPFDANEEYRRYVDGKPRYDGVQSVLEARGIRLPFGRPEDHADEETVCGLGNRKDQLFQRWLVEHRVRTYPGTLRLIKELRNAGIPIAVFSASRNAEAVLRNAGVLDLFDARVDGRDLDALGLPGKPDPAMLREAARRLDVAPERAAVLEDAIAGVKAGMRGAFGLVIGISRGDHAEALRSAGADLVVRDASELAFTPRSGLTVKTLADLPSVRDCESEIRQRLSDNKLVVFLDYDGTLTPIIADHAKAILSEDMRSAVASLASLCTVAIVSGRDLGTLQRLIGLDTVVYAGSHGFEIVTPEGGGEGLERGIEFLAELDKAEEAVRTGLANIEGHSVERKRFSVAVHYRRVARARDIEHVRAVVERVLAGHPRLRRGEGKMVFEIQPDIDWNKGRAVMWILERLGLDRPAVMPLYVGDDLTDEDAFQHLAGRGLTIAVRDGETRPTAADYALSGTADVRYLLDLLTRLVKGRDAQDGRGWSYPTASHRWSGQ